jgi:hypothetical protein
MTLIHLCWSPAHLWSTNSVQEFAEFAHARDVSEGVPGRTPLELPYAIDGDRVGGLTVKLMFSKASWPQLLYQTLLCQTCPEV